MSDFMEMREHLEKNMALPYRLEFELQGVPEALNKMLRMHWTKKNKHNQYWIDYVASETRMRRPSAPLAKAKLTLIRYSPRTLDYDNAVASFKAVVDGLTRCGIIANDSWPITGAWCVDQVKHPTQRIRVVVEEVRE